MSGMDSGRTGRWGSSAQATHCSEGEAGFNVFLEGTMEGTQRSQPISMENQKIAEQSVCGPALADRESGPPLLIGEASLSRIAVMAGKDPEMVFTSLAHRIDLSLLKKSFKKLRKNESTGVDKMTAKQYAVNLDENLYNLYERLRRGQYAASPVKRIWVDREGGKKRPVGIPAPEDKIVQKAVSMIPGVVCEPLFHDFSHGFREGHNQHQAVKEIREKCPGLNINWIISADITGLFDNIDHQLLRETIRKRVNDGGIMRLIGKWLNAGVVEDDDIIYPEKGTPRGGVVSPVLSNIFLHYVLDDWFVKEVQPRMKGKCFLVRFADDLIIGCQLKSDSGRLMEVLPKRFERFKLSLHPEKTQQIQFGKPSGNGKGRGTFDFLGFTFYWARSGNGYWVIKKKTARKRLNRFLRMLWSWCKASRHDPSGLRYSLLCSKLRGFYQYFGVRANYKTLEVAYEYAAKAWRHWLSRRNSKGKVFFDDLRKRHPLPMPGIVHNF